MTRQFDDSALAPSRLESPVGDVSKPAMISFAQRLAASENFKALFKEGMSLVEESAGYLDGAGREEAKHLHRTAAMAYATESMRLTTRLMQLASWLLLQRAVNERQMTPAQATSERHRVRLAQQEVACPPDLFEELPLRLRTLSSRSIRLQARIIHLDQSLAAARSSETAIAPSPIASQVERLRAAFGA